MLFVVLLFVFVVFLEPLSPPKEKESCNKTTRKRFSKGTVSHTSHLTALVGVVVGVVVNDDVGVVDCVEVAVVV